MKVLSTAPRACGTTPGIQLAVMTEAGNILLVFFQCQSNRSADLSQADDGELYGHKTSLMEGKCISDVLEIPCQGTMLK